MFRFFIIILILFALWLLIGFGAFKAAMGRGKRLDLNDKKKIKGTSWERWYDEITAGIRWFEQKEQEVLTIESYDGLTLYGNLIPNPDARGTIILFHGYRTFPECDFSADAWHYYGLGYHLLTVDQRACGRSGGKHITFGVKERYDCRSWIDYVSERFGPEHEIFLAGLSLGGSTVVMASGLGLPDQVKGIIEDSAFTSPKEIIGRTIRTKYHLPAKFLLPVIGFWCRLLEGISLDAYSTMEAMETNRTPILFVHGKEDDYVPWEMTVKTYEACQAPKTLYLVEGAVHGVGYLIEPEQYRQKLTEFFTFCQERKTLS